LFQYNAAEKKRATKELHGQINPTDGHELGQLEMRDPSVILGFSPEPCPWRGRQAPPPPRRHRPATSSCRLPVVQWCTRRGRRRGRPRVTQCGPNPLGYDRSGGTTIRSGVPLGRL
jgi:hypothetical protein